MAVPIVMGLVKEAHLVKSPYFLLLPVRLDSLNQNKTENQTTMLVQRPMSVYR